MTNPYQAPPELDWQTSADPGPSAVNAKQFIAKLSIIGVAVACSGACFGGLLGLLAGPAGMFVGGFMGFCIALIPALVSSVLCMKCVPAMLPDYSEQRKNMVIGLASGALAGFVSVIVLTGSSGAIQGSSLLLSAVTSAFGAGGGLGGAFLVNRWLLRSVE